MVAILAVVVVGLLIGYERWGTTATVVTIVERELASMGKRINAVERRINTLESRAAETGQGKPSPIGAPKLPGAGSDTHRKFRLIKKKTSQGKVWRRNTPERRRSRGLDQERKNQA